LPQRHDKARHDNARHDNAVTHLKRGGLTRRSFSLARHRTSVALEDEFWSALLHIAAVRNQTLSALVATADAERNPGQPLASALRILALRAFCPSLSPEQH